MKLCINFVLLITLALSTGCVKTVVTSDHVSVSTTRFLWPGAIGKASIVSTNGTQLSLEGYQSDPTKLIETIATGVAAGTAKGLKP